MVELKKLLRKIYHAPDSQIPALAGTFFLQISKIYPVNEIVKEMVATISAEHMLWDDIRYRLVTLRRSLRLERKKNPELKEIFNIINSFEVEVEKRGKHLTEICHTLAHDSIPYYLELTSLNPNTFGTKIKQSWNKLDTPENQTYLGSVCIKKTNVSNPNLQKKQKYGHTCLSEMQCLSNP